MSWTPQQEAKARRLWALGLTTRQIGERIGMSRNAVIGKRYRQDWQRGPEFEPEPEPEPPPPPKPAPPRPKSGHHCIETGCRNPRVSIHGRCSICEAKVLNAKPQLNRTATIGSGAVASEW